MIRLSTGVLALGAALALGGCGDKAPPPLAAAPANPFPFDGSYRGTVTLTGISSGGKREWCETDPVIAFTIASGTFAYVQPHPKVPLTAGTGSATANYTVNVAYEGTLHGQSNGGGNISGRVSAGHVTGTINGIACFYTFTADKV